MRAREAGIVERRGLLVLKDQSGRGPCCRFQGARAGKPKRFQMPTASSPCSRRRWTRYRLLQTPQLVQSRRKQSLHFTFRYKNEMHAPAPCLLVVQGETDERSWGRRAELDEVFEEAHVNLLGEFDEDVTTVVLWVGRLVHRAISALASEAISTKPQA